jgi:hypothetical protein
MVQFEPRHILVTNEIYAKFQISGRGWEQQLLLQCFKECLSLALSGTVWAHVRLKQPDKSAVAEYNFNTGHRIDFSSTSVLDKATGYMARIVKEVIEIRLNTATINQPTKKLTKGGVLRKRQTSSLARFNHSCVRDALLEMVNGALKL